MDMRVSGMTGQVSFDGRFVTIERHGFRARVTVGKGEKRIPVSSVSAVQWKPASLMVNGFIQFSVPGGVESRSGFGSQTTNAVGDENSVVFTKKQMPEFAKLRSAVEEAMAGLAQGAPVAAVSGADELRKLAELRDAGILTEEEFAAKKAQLLGV